MLAPRINAAKRDREAAVEKAEAEKILAVKAAEAEAEAKHLSGKLRHMRRLFRGARMCCGVCWQSAPDGVCLNLARYGYRENEARHH